MKTSEFIKRVEELGYVIKKVEFNKTIEVFEGQKYHGCVTEKGINVVRTNNAIPNDLFNLIIEYAKTPLEEREEPKKYYIRPKGMKLIRTNFVFNYYVNDGEWSLYGKDETRLAKTRFTLKELEDLGINPEHYDLEEIE